MVDRLDVMSHLMENPILGNTFLPQVWPKFNMNEKSYNNTSIQDSISSNQISSSSAPGEGNQASSSYIEPQAMEIQDTATSSSNYQQQIFLPNNDIPCSSNENMTLYIEKPNDQFMELGALSIDVTMDPGAIYNPYPTNFANPFRISQQNKIDDSRFSKNQKRPLETIDEEMEGPSIKITKT